MKNKTMNRKQFLKSVGKAGLCACAAAASVKTALAAEPFAPVQTKPGDTTPERAVKRMEFADLWVKRFFDVIDRTLDPETRKKLMMANGQNCYQDWIKETKQKTEPIDFDQWAVRVAQRPPREDLKVEGRVIYFQYNSSAETGAASPEGVCLCSMVESKPAGMSPTYCHCSVGYVKEMFELRFGRKVDVELLDSVLRGGKRCKFKITVS